MTPQEFEKAHKVVRILGTSKTHDTYGVQNIVTGRLVVEEMSTWQDAVDEYNVLLNQCYCEHEAR